MPLSTRNRLNGFRSQGANWEEKKILLEPYLLGIWLGDGLNNGSGFSSNNNKIIRYWMNWTKKNYGDQYKF